MKNRIIAKAEKRTIAVMLSFIMAIGIFTGMRLDVNAKTISYSDITETTIIYEGDIITVPKSTSSGKGIILRLYCDIPNQSEISEFIGYALADVYENASAEVHYLESEGKTYTAFKLYHIVINPTADFVIYELDFKVLDESEAASGSTGSAQSHTCNFAQSHTCNFQWTTTVDPSAGTDGLEEYKCAVCGLVKESHAIPVSVAAVKNFYGDVKEAPANGSITYDSGKLYTISDYLLKKMSERSDVTVTVNFEYQNAKYAITFPAGTDYSAVLNDEENMYGYFGVAAKLGLTVIAR